MQRVWFVIIIGWAHILQELPALGQNLRLASERSEHFTI